MIRPSSLPMLQQCSAFSSGVAGEFAEAGQDRHAALTSLLKDDDADGLSLLEPEQAEVVLWAEEYIRTKAPMDEHPLHSERTLTLLDGEFNEIMRGTPDVVCGGELFDLKWRERDYGAQMAAYALMLMEESGRTEIRVHVIFGAFKRVEVYEISKDGAEKLVNDILESAKTPTPTPCDYCGWCSKRLTCQPFLDAAEKVAKGYSDLPAAQEWHPSKMETGEEIAAALWIWRTILSKWGESVEFHAFEAATKKGMTLPGFDLKSKAGRSWCSDVATAFTVSKLPQNFFLMCCDLRMNTSKTNASKKGLIDMYAGTHGMPKARAKREISTSLTEAGVLKQGDPVQYLKAVGTVDDAD